MPANILFINRYNWQVLDRFCKVRVNIFWEAFMQNEIEMLIKKLNNLEKKLEKYYSILFTENELDFILNGTYILQQDIDDVLVGNY